MVRSQKRLRQPPAPLPPHAPEAVNSMHRRKPKCSWQQADVGSRCSSFPTLARARVQVLLKPTDLAPRDTHPSNEVPHSLTPPDGGYLSITGNQKNFRTTCPHPRFLFFTCDEFASQGEREFSASVALVGSEFMHILPRWRRIV